MWHQSGDGVIEDSKRLVFTGGLQLVLVYVHNDAAPPHESAELTAILTRGDEMLAAVEGHAANGMFASAPNSIRVSLSVETLQLGEGTDRIWGGIMLPRCITREQIEIVRTFLRERPGIRLVDEIDDLERPTVTDCSLPALGLGGGRLRRGV